MEYGKSELLLYQTTDFLMHLEGIEKEQCHEIGQ